MKPDSRFTMQPKSFWAHVRSISEEVGYTTRGQGTIKVPNTQELINAMQALKLSSTHLVDDNFVPSELGRLLLDYFGYRAQVLNGSVQSNLMDAEAAKNLFLKLKRRYKPKDSILPMNKQKGEKKATAYLTGKVNMLINAHSDGMDCDYDPRVLTTFTARGQPLRTLARRVDGAFPSVVNPIAIWEIKEYYYTTTFGSRVADGVYESLLDGMELEELREHEGYHARHYLIVDSRFTWWKCGRSYLCRIIDMLHMGYIDEVLFGKEIVDRIPDLVREWLAIARNRESETGLPGSGREPTPEGHLKSAKK